MPKRGMKRKESKLKRPKLCLICSAGGHLAEMSHLKKCYSKYPRFFITFERVDTKNLSKKERVYFIEDPGRSPIKFIRSLFQGFDVLKKERPDVMLSTGAGVAVGPCYMAKIFLKSKVIFLESFCRTEAPSLSGRLMYPVSDLFFVQWKNLLRNYGKKAIYRGAIV